MAPSPRPAPQALQALEARFLGAPEFRLGGRVLPCSSRKAVWAAAHLLLTRRRQPRATLAALVWGGDSRRHGLGSLRVALTKLPAPVLACLDITRSDIGVAENAPVTIDVEAFAAQCAAADPQAQARAVALYGGDLLHGDDDEMSPEFADWLLAERTRLRQMAHDVHLRLAQRLAAEGQRERAREAADAWLRHDPASEELHRLVMGWLPRDQALAQYEVYRRARAVTHGAPPSEPMAALAERLREGAGPGTLERPLRLTAATSFFGRADELAALHALLAEPGCRLLTLRGLGGVGKTRLASALVEREAASYGDEGVHVVPLEAVQSPALFAQAVARTCGLQPTGAAAPLDLVAAFLNRRPSLLLLDNVEHLLGEEAGGDASGVEGEATSQEAVQEAVQEARRGVGRGAGEAAGQSACEEAGEVASDGPAQPPAPPGPSLPAQLAALLAATGDRVKVLVTSREPLRLQEEWIYELTGLACPAADAPEAQALAGPAVQFFAQRARQADASFSLAAQWPHVVQIATLLEGLPLGLELAASWVRSVPCAEIAADLREHAQALRNRHLNRSARHASLAAVVDYSWRRLPAEQREALMSLAVLRGTFTTECAAFVARASARTLSALAERSLLQRTAGGRWHLHEVVRQFAWEVPGSGPRERGTRQAAVGARRDAWCRRLLEGLRGELQGAGEGPALAAIEAEAPNLREAWDSFVQAGRLDALEATAPAWFELLEARSFTAEGLHWAGRWLQAARAAGDAASAGRALVRLGLFQRFGALTADALASLDEAVVVLVSCGGHSGASGDSKTDPAPDAKATATAKATAKGDAHAQLETDLAEARSVRAFTLFLLGRLEAAEAEAAQAIDAGERLGDPAIVAAGCRVKGLAALQLGRREEGRALQQRALEAATRLGKPSLQASAHNNLALAENHLGHLRAAEAGYENALSLWRALGFAANVGRAMHNLGVGATRGGDHATALTRYRAAFDVLAKAGERNVMALNLMSTGDALVRLGRPEEARAPARQALAMAQRDGHMLPALNARIVLAQAALALGEHAEAAQHLAAVLQGAAEHQFAHVLADAVVSAARLLAAARPGELRRAVSWAADVARGEDASVAVRDDARAWIRALEVVADDSAAPRALDELAREAREWLRPIGAASPTTPAPLTPAAGSAATPAEPPRAARGAGSLGRTTR